MFDRVLTLPLVAILRLHPLILIKDEQVFSSIHLLTSYFLGHLSGHFLGLGVSWGDTSIYAFSDIGLHEPLLTDE